MKKKNYIKKVNLPVTFILYHLEDPFCFESTWCLWLGLSKKAFRQQFVESKPVSDL
jgi:hypothetical protein